MNPGDQVLVPNPGYPTYTSLNRILGSEIVNYNLREDNHWQPDFDELERMDLSRVKIMWTNYPNMPTGANATMELYEKLVDFARRHNIVIVNDNPYSFILNRKPISILNVPGAKECCIEFNSMSKSHNMPGWRVGMLATNAKFVQWILKSRATLIPVRSVPCNSQQPGLIRTAPNGMKKPTYRFTAAVAVWLKRS